MKTIHYVLSEQCNLNCTYCGVDKKNTHYMNFDSFLIFYNDYLKNETEEYNFDIFGGEPFIHAATCLNIIKFLNSEEKCNSIRITTNGTIYNKYVESIIKHSKTVITISHDGLYHFDNRPGINPSDYINNLKHIGNDLKSVNKVIKIHSMLTGNMFNNDVPDNYMEREAYFTNIMQDQIHYIKSIFKMNGVTGSIIINFEIVRDKGSWNQKQAENFIKHYKHYVEELLFDVYKCCYFDFNEIDSLYTSYASALIESVLNKDYQRPTCGVNTGKHQTYFKNKMIQCERFERYQPAQEYLYITSKFDKLYNKCNNCGVRKVCNRGCIYETILNKQPIDEICYIIKESFKIVQESFKWHGGLEVLKLFKGDKIV